MRTLIIILFFIPFAAAAQKQQIFINLIAANGQPIKGDGVTRGFERTIEGLSSSSGGKNNSQFSFTMNISGAAADLKKAMNANEFLTSGLITFVQTGVVPQVMYTIKMEKIKVMGCNESMGCNSTLTTSVIFQATRIGWTYYQANPKGGAGTVTNKYGYDNDTNGPWANF